MIWLLHVDRQQRDMWIQIFAHYQKDRVWLVFESHVFDWGKEKKIAWTPKAIIEDKMRSNAAAYQWKRMGWRTENETQKEGRKLFFKKSKSSHMTLFHCNAASYVKQI